VKRECESNKGYFSPTHISRHPRARRRQAGSSWEVALRVRSSRRPFECPCDQCQGYATDDPDEPDLDGVKGIPRGMRRSDQHSRKT